MTVIFTLIALLIITGAAAGFASWLKCWHICRMMLFAWALEIDAFVAVMLYLVLVEVIG